MTKLETNGKPKIINWSGGPDSTACLVDLLEYTSDPVIAYHFFVLPNNHMTLSSDYDNDQPGERLETNAVRQLTPFLKEHYRDFEVRVITLTTPQNPDNYYEMGLFPLLSCINSNGEYYSGRCIDDKDLWDHVGDPLYHFVERRQSIENAFESLQITLYNKEKTKQQIRKDLGEKIWKMTWSCTDPTPNNKPCGTCSRCEINKKTRASKKKKSSKE